MAATEPKYGGALVIPIRPSLGERGRWVSASTNEWLVRTKSNISMIKNMLSGRLSW